MAFKHFWAAVIVGVAVYFYGRRQISSKDTEELKHWLSQNGYSKLERLLKKKGT